MSYIEELFTNNKYRDRWVMISLPGEPAFDGYIKGFYNDENFSLSKSMDTGDENIEEFSNLLSGSEKGQEVAQIASRSFNDIITYNGANNQSLSFNITVVPEISQKMNSEQLELFLAKLILPKKYTLSTKFLGVSNFESHINSLSTGTALVDILKKAGNSVGASDYENTLDKGLTHIYFGDNVRLTGMVITDVQSNASVIRVEGGQFYSYELSISAVPYRLLDAEAYVKMITNTNNSTLRGEL